MHVLRHKRFGCSAVYDKDSSDGMKAVGFGFLMDKIWMKAAALGQKWTNGRNLDFYDNLDLM